MTIHEAAAKYEMGRPEHSALREPQIAFSYRTEIWHSQRLEPR